MSQDNNYANSIAGKLVAVVFTPDIRIVASVLIWIMCASLPFTVTAQDKTKLPEGSIQQPPDYSVAPVMVDGRLLFKVRGVSAFPAIKRAERIAATIKQIAAEPSVAPDSIHLERKADRIAILGGNEILFYIYKEDADLDNISDQLYAEAAVIRIKEAIKLYRSDRSATHLTISTIYTLGATLLLILVVYISQRLFNWLHRIAERHYKSKLDALKIQSLKLVQTEQLWLALSSLLTVIKVLLWLILFYIYINLVMGFFPWTRRLAESLLSVILNPLQVIGGGIINALPNVVFLIILFFVTRYILKITRLLFTSLLHGSIKFSGFDPEWSLPTYRLIRILVIALALVVAYPYIPGSSSEAFKAISLFMGVIFSLGSSSLISNIVAGNTMTYRRAFKVGDRIRVDDVLGDVTEIRLLVTRLRSIKNEEITIPNSIILNSKIVNFSSLAEQQGLILHTTVGIGYEVPWRQVHAMLLLAAERTQGLLPQPKPFVLQKSLGDFAVNYELNVYCAEAKNSAQLYDRLHQNIQDVFNEYNIQIMTPAYVSDTPSPKTVPKEQWYTAPAESPGSSGSGG